MSSHSLLNEKSFDVTSTCNKVLCCARSTLYLEPEEAMLKSETCIGKSEKRLPYGELGSVDQTTACGCCHGFTSNLSSVDPESKSLVPISPGCGCDEAMVNEIVVELQKRMKGRGDTGNIHRSEEAILRQRFLNEKVELILQQMSIPAPPKLVNPNDDGHKMEPFSHVGYDVTECCAKLCCTTAQLNLEPEEVHYVRKSPCSKSVKRFPYGQLGDVDSGKGCGCCVRVSSSQLGGISPGFGCNEDLVNEIATELKRRMKARGDTGNIQRQEFANKITRDSDAMVDAILSHLNISAPRLPDGLQKTPEMQKMK